MRRFSIPCLVVVCAAWLISPLGSAFVERVFADTSTPASIATSGVAVTENFNTLASSGTSSTTPTGWGFVESSGNTVYTAGTGSGNAGDTYSFGAASAADRALGTLRSGTNIPTIGAAFTNNTGNTITSLAISYTGEQWRLGTAARGGPDRLDFQLGVTATSLTSVGYVDVDPLDFTGPVAAGTVGALDGNAAANRVGIGANITGLTIPSGATFFIRWLDVDVANADDGLAVDDFSLTATTSDTAPSVIATVPTASASNVAVNAAVSITFSESVAASASAFAITCNSVTQAFTATASPATVYTLTPSSNLPFSANCTVTVAANQIADSDVIDPPDQMAASHSFSFDTAGPSDAAPFMTSTVPSTGADDVLVTSNVVINFSESVTAASTAFSLDCNGPKTFSLIGSGSSALTIDPDGDLPYATSCSLSVTASGIFDADNNDPPDNVASNFTVSFMTEDASPPVATNIIINEVDSDQVSTDTAELIELYDGGTGGTSLTGLTVVLYNGSNSLSYAAYDLDGKVTDAAGYFTLGNAAPGIGLVFPNDSLQNGADAVALYVGNASGFPNGTPVTQTGLLDAVVYDTADPDVPGLLTLLNAGEPQVNENGGGNGTGHSIGRCENGTGGQRNTSTYTTGAPSPGATNNCPPPPPPPSNSIIVISQVYGAGGNNGAVYQNDYVELFNRGTVTVDTGGWSLQYASADGGSGWNFNKTPLGGPIAPGEYYLVKLGPTGVDGLPLPAANVSGPINMSGTNGKIALVNSFDGLVGTCPIGNPSVMDLVGYGTADCFEGAGAAAAASTTTALFRNGGGLIDTDTNSADLSTGAPGPRRTAPIVELGPIVLSTDPSSNGFNVPRDPTIVVTFTEPVTAAAPWFDITCSVSGQHNLHTQAGGGTTWNITPNVNMVPAEQCTMTIQASQIHDVDTDDSAPNTDTLSANYTWSWTVATGTAPPYSADVHLTMGNPSSATASISDPLNFLMEKPEYALSYNQDLGRPNWVSWHLSPEWYGGLARVDTFRADPQVPPDWYRVQGFDFSGSGFDRGHMVPNADRNKLGAIPINQATYLMTNMLAQAPGNNQGPWADMEAYLRTVADAGNELYVVSGPAGIGGTGNQGGVTLTLADGHVTVPSSTWKVAIVLPSGVNDVSRATCTTRTIAVIMPNTHAIENDDWQGFITSVDAVEELTGYNFFSNLPDNVEYCVEAGINGVNPPEDLTPPAISCAAADGAWHATNVSLTCTASDAGSGLANVADASFSLITSVAPGNESINTSTDSRLVCDALGNCATAGPIAGNMIDRKAPAITITTPASGASYQLNSVVTASFSCVDSGAGSGTCVGTVANGAAVNTASAGAKTFVVTATDAVGNTTSITVGYTVLSAVQSLEAVAAQLRAIIAASTKAPLTARARNALRKVEDAIAELSQTPPDTHHASISIRQAVQQIEGLRSQGLLPIAVANALLAQLAGVSY